VDTALRAAMTRTDSSCSLSRCFTSSSDDEAINATSAACDANGALVVSAAVAVAVTVAVAVAVTVAVAVAATTAAAAAAAAAVGSESVVIRVNACAPTVNAIAISGRTVCIAGNLEEFSGRIHWPVSSPV
jgi:hypothetical protein